MFYVDECIGFISNRLVQLFHRAFEKRLSAFGLTAAQFCVLSKLYEEEGLTQTELASRLHVESPTLVRTLDKMEESRLITRRKDPEDRRAYRIYLLERAHKLRPKLEKIGEEIQDMSLSGLSENEIENLKRYLFIIWKNLEDNV